jgi:predicted transcriptional regulator of viral defense system
MTIVWRRDLLAAGFTRDEVRRDLRSGNLVSVRRGAYTREALPPGPDERHRLQVRATVAELAEEVIVSHVSAAVLHELPTWGMPLDRVHATRARRSGGRRGRALHLHAARWSPTRSPLWTASR